MPLCVSQLITQGQQIILFDTNGASIASMQDSGNFVLYDSTGTTVLWESFDYPTDTLLADQRLRPHQTLFSSVSVTDQSIGVFKLSMQDNGNLVLYPNRGTEDLAYWASDTVGPNVTLNLDPGGFMYLSQNSTFVIKNYTERGYPTKDAIYRLTLDVDGILRLYYHDLSNMSVNGSVKWESSLYKCVAKGLCGLNGYCLEMNKAANCQCIPGFEFVDEKRRSLGCERNYTVESCKVSGVETSIHMTNLTITRLDDAAYVIQNASTQAECSSACLNDCNCEAALFTGQECKLQGLPLRYIQVDDSASSVVLIKVYSSSIENGLIPTNQSIVVKKVQQRGIIVIGGSLISFAVLVLLISGVIVYKSRVWAYKKISENQSVQLLEGIGPQAFSYAAMAVDIARGILYLHDGCENPIIHCDIKPQNILMDEHRRAKICDFGIAKLLEYDQTKTSTLLRGTPGYIAPEWIAKQHDITGEKQHDITVKVDVYSFGIVLFNILCCRKHVDKKCVLECYEKDELSKLVDYDDDEYVKKKEEVEQMVKIGLWCVQEDPSLRPHMKEVVLMLEGSVNVGTPPSHTSFFSAV
ncbi:hypothetical protein QVD17_15694 [Tagetes erecta]|uniref:Uncharacterized protein n=1 Tax=Tagetes erecta TaxID=13708 RepID=A0AAD8KQ45_TARER|nr:hypothetical protein QVD17_15694 [Tagetes erecta]